VSRVDVVIPVRDGGPLLRRAVDSVLSQEGVEPHVIVVDDGSTDGAPDRLPRHERLVIVPSAGRGIPAALNTGIRRGSGGLIARQDADDESLPDRLRAQVAFLDAHAEIGLVATRFEVVAGRRTLCTMGPGPAGMLDKNPICAGSTVVRRSVSEAAGHYREPFALSSDYDMWLRCAWLSGVAVLDVVGYRYRLGASMSTIRRGRLQAAYAELARGSARARMDGRPDPAADPAAVRALVDGMAGADPAAEAELADWWAREFAALGARRDAWRLLRAAAGSLGPRRSVRSLARIAVPGAPQGGWG
jgi:glycosyltransferase involved in cell wall biosynthesis